MEKEIKRVAQRAWLKSSLASDNAQDYLDHLSPRDQSGVYYCPITWRSQDKKVRWHLKEVKLRRPGYSFSIPADQLTAVFVDIKRSCLIFALKDTQYFDDNSNPDLPPYDRYMFNDNGETDFWIHYINQKGSPFVINPEVVKKMTVKR